MSNAQRFLLGLCLVGLLSGCVTTKVGISQFSPVDKAIANDDGTFTISDPADRIVILYTGGSASNEVVGTCQSMGGAPGILLDQVGTEIAGKTVLVHGYCSQATGRLPARSMSEARAPDLEGIVAEYHRQGVPPRQIFLSGHSMGGWAAVLVGARKNVEIGGFIAFAPANGVWTKQQRGAIHEGVVRRQTTSVEGLDRLDGLVFTFYGDPFNSPEDLEHLAAIPGIEFVATEPCRGQSHFTFRQSCFAEQFVDKVRTFVESRILSPGG